MNSISQFVKAQIVSVHIDFDARVAYFATSCCWLKGWES